MDHHTASIEAINVLEREIKDRLAFHDASAVSDTIVEALATLSRAQSGDFIIDVGPAASGLPSAAG